MSKNMDQISLWFVCKSCRFSFSGVTNFIKHKTDSHFSEFKSVACIVFEESFSNVKADIITRPKGIVESHVDGIRNQGSERSQSPKTLINNISTVTNSVCEILEENKHFKNHELDNVESRAVSFTIENDSVTINVGPLNDVDSAPNQIALTQVDAPENEICDEALMQSATVTVQEILDSSESKENEQTLNLPNLHKNSDSELSVFSPEPVDLALDSSQLDVEINSVISSFDVCTDATADDSCVHPGPDPAPCQSKSEQAKNTYEMDTSLAPVELFEHRTCTTTEENNKDVFHLESYDTSFEVVNNKYGFLENPFVLLRRLTHKELQSALSISKEPIKKQSKSIHGAGSDMERVIRSDSEICDTYYPKRRKLNSKKKQVGSETSEPPNNHCLNTASKTTAKRKLPISLHCDLCNKTFKFRSGVILHNFLNHLPTEEKMAQARFKCDQCPKVFYRRGALRSHADTHKSKTERNMPFVCEICGYSCIKKSNLEKHLASHSDSRPFKCPFPNCDKAFKRKNNLKAHVDVSHSKLTPFKCSHPNCTKAFKESKALKAHILGVHVEKPRYPVQLLPCTQDYCDKQYGSRHGLKQHLIMVHSVGSARQTFLCELCGKAFKMKQNLQIHTLAVHTQECSFKCRSEGCSAAFKLKSRLVKHEQAHGGAPNYLCTVCGKSYSAHISFHKHELSHKKDSSSSFKATV